MLLIVGLCAALLAAKSILFSLDDILLNKSVPGMEIPQQLFDLPHDMYAGAAHVRKAAQVPDFSFLHHVCRHVAARLEKRAFPRRH